MAHTTMAPQTPPLRPILFADTKSKPQLRIVDTSLSPDDIHYLDDDGFDNQPCSPQSPVSSSHWEDATSTTSASIPSTPTTQISIHEPLLSHELSSKSSQTLISEPLVKEVKIPPESFGGPIAHLAPQWHLRGDIYTFSFWTSQKAASSLPEHAYSPLEGVTSFADETYSRPVGGLSMIQILSYRDSPIGPYDEMLVAPGSFEWERTETDGKKTRGCNPKITRIYVSTPNSCFNGRTNWNVPKHLAKFVWDHHPDGSTTIKIYPHDDPSNADESQPSARPFFQTVFKPMPLVPRFPFATSWMDRLGFNTTLAMPPLPSGNGTYGELPSTNRWIKLETKQYCSRSTAGWYDVQQPDAGAACGGHENFLPWLGRWQVGVKMEDAFLSFDVPQETWDQGDKLSDATSDDDDDNDGREEEPEKWNTTFLHDYFT
ncbi:hypothetical protein HDV63DRAFT_358160 [Trichoderma sp. SZMC 28014]